jgi:restriction endonuclease S subunit
MDKLKNIKIPIPTLEEQEKYISYCENNQKEIENNQKEIENNIIIAKEFLNKML